jgi:PAS domain S-box-containing protein
MEPIQGLTKDDGENKSLNGDRNPEILEILERISDAFVAVSSDWKITYINKKARHVTNFRTEEVVGKDLWTVFPASVFANFPALAKEAAASQTPRHHEDYIATFDRWIEAHIYPSETGLSIYFNDITERKRTQLKLSESERRLHTIIQVEPECVKILGSAFELLEMNPAGLAMIEADNLEQVLGKSVLGLVSPDHREDFEMFVRNVFAGNPGVMEFEMMSLKGSIRWIETHAVPLRNEEGIVTSFLGVSRDVTDRKIAEKKYRDIFNNILTGVYQARPDGKLITANPAMAKMLGYGSPSELIDSVNDIFLLMYAASKDSEHIKNLLERRERVQGMDLKMLTRNGEKIWVKANTVMVRDVNGELLHIEGTLEDVTANKRAERKLKKQFKILQKTNHELDRFVYSASHDLRAPLASILGLINISRREQISEAQSQYLKMMEASVHRLDGFIRKILDYSKNARTDITIDPIDFKAIIDEAYERVKLIEPKLHLTLAIEGKGVIYSDKNRIGIIIDNLLSNAIKFQDPTKDSSRINITIHLTDERAAITFSDNGIGIEEKYLPKVFDMFFRATEKGMGSGLGLYIVKETLRKLKGTISVRSVFTSFTIFELFIPNLEKMRSSQSNPTIG